MKSSTLVILYFQDGGLNSSLGDSVCTYSVFF